MSFVEDFNEKLGQVQEELDLLFTRSKEQVLSLEDKSNSSFTELSNIFRRDTALEDTFVDGSKIFSSEGILFDKDGWTNTFTVEEVKFLPEYYTKVTFPLTMAGGRVIPGSNFAGIFSDRDGFWGYMRDDEQKVDTEFTLTFDLTKGVPHLNKLYLRTNNSLIIEGFYRSSFQGEWVSLGLRSGQHHVWTESFDAVEVRFTCTTNIISVSLVQAGKATFGSSGILTSTYHTVDNLRFLTIEKDADTPPGTSIRTFVHISNDPDQDPPGSGLIEWEEEKLVTLANDEYRAPTASGYIIPSGYIESSLVVRTGYRTWETIDTTDYSIVTESIDRLADSYLDIPAGYKVISEGLKALYSGTGETRVEYSEGDDYTVVYDVEGNTIRVNYLTGGRLPSDPVVEPTAEVIIRKPTTVLQRRTFVNLEIDREISITIPTTGIIVRTLHVGDTIENETTVQDPDVGVYTFDGKKGLNLIEIEGHNVNNPPELFGSYDYFSTRYRQRKSETTPPGSNEFYLEPAGGGLKLVSAGSDLYIRYLVPTEYNNISVRFEMDGREDISPTMRSYKLVNRIDRE